MADRVEDLADIVARRELEELYFARLLVDRDFGDLGGEGRDRRSRLVLDVAAPDHALAGALEHVRPRYRLFKGRVHQVRATEDDAFLLPAHYPRCELYQLVLRVLGGEVGGLGVDARA